jgi:phospholipid N-methyltransferase
MDWIKFIKQYIKKPSTVGAVLPSSDNLASKMIEDVDFNASKCIVEYGPGTGVFTEKLIQSRSKETILILMEYNQDFYNMLVDKYKQEKNLYIINDSAENIAKYLKDYKISEVDYIVSGLPFASLPKNVSSNILNVSKEILKKDGKFITFQYTLFKKEFINKFFGKIDIKREIKNIPPAYVFSCNN